MNKQETIKHHQEYLETLKHYVGGHQGVESEIHRVQQELNKLRG